MNSFKKYIILLALPLFLFYQGCNDALDLRNIGAYDPGDIWNKAETAQFYVNDLISLTLGGGWENVNGWTDECSRQVALDAVTIDNTARKAWPYQTIRRINVGFEELEAGDMSDLEKSQIRGQLHFLRAYIYFNMVVHHGGVPIITHPQSADEDLHVTRNSTAETFQFVIDELDNALATDMLERGQGANYGRLSKAAVHAFKGRVLLFKASPQFNPGNPWDNAFWQEAYAANKAAYDELSAMGFALMPSYSDIMGDTKGQVYENEEYILKRILQFPDAVMGWRPREIRPLSESTGATGADQATWDFVKLYPMADGFPIGESPNYVYDIDTYFENRDPRFYATLYFNGGLAEISNKPGRRQYTTDDIMAFLPPGQEDDVMRDALLGVGTWGRTGFFPKKQIMEQNTVQEVQENDKDFPFIRFAEVILNLAEAANETGRQAEAIDMLRLIRDRAGIEPGADNNYGMDVSSRTALRQVIHNERAIEFAYEGRRFWDMRRWRRLHEWHEEPKRGLYARVRDELWTDASKTELVRNPANFELTPEDFTYEEVVLEVPGADPLSYFPESYYFFPIRLAELELNNQLEQNIGWAGGTFNPTLE